MPKVWGNGEKISTMETIKGNILLKNLASYAHQLGF
jgi:hypothetical protein